MGNPVERYGTRSSLDDISQSSGDFMADKYLSFLIGELRYAFPIKSVREIIGIRSIIPVPEFPEYAKGIINIRGDVIPVIDMHLRFHQPETVHTAHTCIIIINYDDASSIGFIVDNVSDVAALPPEKISPSPRIAAKNNVSFVLGVGKDDDGSMIMLLDVDKLLTKEMRKELSDAQDKRR